MKAKSVGAEQERAVLRVTPEGRELTIRSRSSDRGRRRAAWGDSKGHHTAGNARLRWFLHKGLYAIQNAKPLPTVRESELRPRTSVNAATRRPARFPGLESG